MAFENEELILEINAEKAADELVTLNKELEDLLKTRTEYQEKQKAGIELSKDEQKQFEILKISIKQQQEAYKSSQKILDGYEAAKKRDIDTTKFQNNSISANRALLKDLTAQYIELQNPSQKATDTIRRLSDTLKQQEGAIGDTRRNVGNYRESILQAAASLPFLGKGIQGINAIASANPIGALAQGAASLFNIISQNKEVMDLLEQATAGLSAATGVFRDGVVELGKSMFTTGENSKGFGEKVSDAFARASKGYGVMADGFRNFSFKQIADGFIQIGTGVENSTDKLSGFITNMKQIAAQNAQAAKEQQALNDAVRKANEENAKAEVQIAQLVKQSKDRTKSDEDRIALLTKAQEFEKKRLAEETENATRQIQILEKQFQGRKLTDEQEDQLSQARVKRTELEKSSILLQEKIQNDLNALEQSITDDKKKRADEEQKIIDRRNQALEELFQKNKERERLFAEATNEGQEKRLAIFELEFETRREKLRDATVGEADITRIYEQEKTAILQDEANKRAEILAKDREENERAIRTLRDNAEKQLELQRLTGQTQLEVDDEFAASTFQTFAEFYERKKKAYTDDLNFKKQSDDEWKRSEQSKVSATGTVANSIIGFIGQVADATGAGAEFQKGVAFAQVLVNQALAIASAVVGATASAASTGPGAIVTTPTFIATLVGSVLAVFGSIISLFSKANVPSKPKIGALGGDMSIDVGGRSHAEGGTKYYGEDGNRFELERDEKIFVLKKDASQKIGMLSAWNQFWGGRSWTDSPVRNAATGGAVISDGGFAIRESTRSNNNSEILTMIKEFFSAMPTPEVSVVEIEKVQKRRNKSISISEIG